jgi:hypothetical protein
MSKKGRKEVLQRIWYRSRGEETGAQKVYRSAPSYDDIPPSRAPEVFTLRPDGTLVEGVTGPADAVTEIEGTWELDGDDLAFYRASAGEPSRVLKISSVDEDRLVVEE